MNQVPVARNGRLGLVFWQTISQAESAGTRRDGSLHDVVSPGPCWLRPLRHSAEDARPKQLKLAVLLSPPRPELGRLESKNALTLVYADSRLSSGSLRMLEHDDPIPEETSPEDLNEYLRLQYHELAELAGSLAHEIKNPLSVIRMNVELLAEELLDLDSPVSRRAQQKIEVVKKQCIRLEGLLNEFLRFTRLSRLQLVPGSLNQQVEQVLDLYEAEAAERHVDIVRYLDPNLPGIRMDKSTMQAALVNLVKNALEAMPRGGELLARTRTTRHGVALDLIDTGEGMHDETLLKMFDAFYTTKDGGSGLGLPMAKRIIEAHGGVINVQSAQDRGTQFTLEFPTLPRI